MPPFSLQQGRSAISTVPARRRPLVKLLACLSTRQQLPLAAVDCTRLQGKSILWAQEPRCLVSRLIVQFTKEHEEIARALRTIIVRDINPHVDQCEERTHLPWQEHDRGLWKAGITFRLPIQGTQLVGRTQAFERELQVSIEQSDYNSDAVDLAVSKACAARQSAGVLGVALDRACDRDAEPHQSSVRFGALVRIGLLASHPIQYHAPLFRELAQRCDLTVYFAHRQTPEGQAAAGFGLPFEWDIDLLSGYRHRFLHNNAKSPPPTNSSAATHRRSNRDRRRALRCLHRHRLGAAFLLAGGVGLPPGAHTCLDPR